ncbi:transglycosylase family protein [Streptomyces sp. t39]|uniref:transglycosylase family protein n=1 Tax=Streptomyces sp. t39 TaxID=1828156 RepID=UPI0011CE9E8B|nr:transglycosylase family protein [Streptomyces sp. t39]TXS55514.1 LysM peptidoglycan-binding domain-containing protein [Streptomyces sp. t39]
MRSGNGRHRRPRQAPAIVVAAGVTGSAIAIPLLGAGSASAADAATWDRVAECESGGNWSIDTDNGYYGGLQLSQEAWESFGGTAYAPSADLASRSQQIAVAEKVLDARGPEAWQACSIVAGLVDDGSDSGVDPGGLPEDLLTPEPDASADPQDTTKGDTVPERESGAGATPEEDGARSPEATKPAGTRPAPDASDGSAADGQKASGAEEESPEPADGATGKHRGEPAREDSEATESEIADKERENGRHASRGDGSARDGVTDAAPAGSYTVQAGDSLWTIAGEREVPGGWSALYQANETTVGDDPDLILPGQSLDLGLEQE